MCHLGHIFDYNGMYPDPCKISCVQDWPTPTNATTLKQFLGLASYYCRCIEKFADIAAPLHNLSKKDVPFSYSPGYIKELKSRLTWVPILPSSRLMQLHSYYKQMTAAVLLVWSCLRAGWTCHRLCQSWLNPVREVIQHHSKRVSCSYIRYEAVSSLSVRSPISAYDRQWTIAMAFCTEDGRLTLLLRFSNGRIKFRDSVSQGHS